MNETDLFAPPPVKQRKIVPKREGRCSFCGGVPSAHEISFRSEIGGLAPEICEGCVEGFHMVVEANRKSPPVADAYIEAHNERVAEIARAEKQP